MQSDPAAYDRKWFLFKISLIKNGEVLEEREIVAHDEAEASFERYDMGRLSGVGLFDPQVATKVERVGEYLI